MVYCRNAFAHHALYSHPTLLVGKTPDEDEQHCMLHVIKNSGKTEMKTSADALKEFNKQYEVSKEIVVELRDAIKNEAQQA